MRVFFFLCIISFRLVSCKAKRDGESAMSAAFTKEPQTMIIMDYLWGYSMLWLRIMLLLKG